MTICGLNTWKRREFIRYSLSLQRGKPADPALRTNRLPGSLQSRYREADCRAVFRGWELRLQDCRQGRKIAAHRLPAGCEFLVGDHRLLEPKDVLLGLQGNEAMTVTAEPAKNCAGIAAYASQGLV
jgi:hypothetical protein